MGIGLLEYADSHPDQVEITAEQAKRETIQTARSVQDQETIQNLKRSIARQLSEGQDPQYILYTAVRAISLLTNDKEWEEQQRSALDLVYKGIEQESLFRDSAATAGYNREKFFNEYVKKSRRQLTESLNGCRRLQEDLEKAIRDINTMIPAAEKTKNKD